MAASLLNPEIIARLGSLELQAKAVVEGTFSGSHASRRLGRSLEFSGHRAYVPGDDRRRIDWKVHARTDRWLIREDEEETNLRAFFFLDASHSMSFSSGDHPSKMGYAAVLTAALSHWMIRGGEFVGLATASQNISNFMAPQGGAGHFAALLERLEKLTAQGSSPLAPSLLELGGRLSKHSLIFLISDFWGDMDPLLSSLKYLKSRRQALTLLQILDPLEMDLKVEGQRLFEDMESGEKISLDASALQASYKKAMSARLEYFSRGVRTLGFDHCLIPTNLPFDAAINLLLQNRLTHRILPKK